MNTPYDVLMGSDSPEKQQAVADSFDAAGGITVGSMPMPKPANSLTMGIKAYHGSPVEDLVAFDSAELGVNFPNRASKAGHWFSTNPDDAKFFGPNVYEVEIDGNYKSLPSMEKMAKAVRDKINDVAYSRRPSDDYRDTPQVASNFVDYLDATQSPKFHTDVTASHLSKARRDGYDGAVLVGGETVQNSSDSGDHIVVFNPELIKIVRKLGIAGASAMLGYNLLEGVDKAQAAELQKADTHHQYTNWLSSGGI